MKRATRSKSAPKSKGRPGDGKSRPEEELRSEVEKPEKKKQAATPTPKDASPLVAQQPPTPRASPGVVLEPDAAPDFFLEPALPVRRLSIEANPPGRPSEPAFEEDELLDHQSVEEDESNAALLKEMLGKSLEFEFISDNESSEKRGRKVEFLLDECVEVIRQVAEINYLAAKHREKGDMIKRVVARLKDKKIEWSPHRIGVFIKRALDEYEIFVKNNMKDTGNQKKGVALMRAELDTILRGVDASKISEQIKKNKKEKKERVRRENEDERKDALAEMTEKFGSGELAAEALELGDTKRPKVKRQSGESDSEASVSSKPRRNKIELELLAAETARANADAATAVARANAESAAAVARANADLEAMAVKRLEIETEERKFQLKMQIKKEEMAQNAKNQSDMWRAIEAIATQAFALKK